MSPTPVLTPSSTTARTRLLARVVHPYSTPSPSDRAGLKGRSTTTGQVSALHRPAIQKAALIPMAIPTLPGRAGKVFEIRTRVQLLNVRTNAIRLLAVQSLRLHHPVQSSRLHHQLTDAPTPPARRTHVSPASRTPRSCACHSLSQSHILARAWF